MPIFEIECSDCKYKGEVLVIERSAPMICPSCGGSNTAKLISATSSLTGRSAHPLPGRHDEHAAHPAAVHPERAQRVPQLVA